MKMYMPLVGSLLVLAVTQSVVHAQDLRKAECAAEGFEIMLPAHGWTEPSQASPPFPGASLALVNQDPDVLASIVVIVEHGKVNLPLSRSTLERQASSISSPAGLRVNSAEFTKIDGFNAAKLDVETDPGTSPEMARRQWHFILPIGGRAYHIMFTARQGAFVRHESLFQAAISSFHVTKDTPLIKVGSGTIFEGTIQWALVGALLLPTALFLMSLAGRRKKQQTEDDAKQQGRGDGEKPRADRSPDA